MGGSQGRGSDRCGVPYTVHSRRFFQSEQGRLISSGDKHWGKSSRPIHFQAKGRSGKTRLAAEFISVAHGLVTCNFPSWPLSLKSAESINLHSSQHHASERHSEVKTITTIGRPPPLWCLSAVRLLDELSVSWTSCVAAFATPKTPD